MLLEEPEGWSELQQKAQQERDPRRLIKIIDQLNALLTELEKRAAGYDRTEQSLEFVKGNQE